MRVTIHSILTLKKIMGTRRLTVELTDHASVRDLLSLMKARWGKELAGNLFEAGTGRLIPHVRVMVNGRQIEFLKGLDTPLSDGDEVLILPLVAGG
jgi:molybdopterin synthase sulfur carrier subunit